MSLRRAQLPELRGLISCLVVAVVCLVCAQAHALPSKVHRTPRLVEPERKPQLPRVGPAPPSELPAVAALPGRVLNPTVSLGTAGTMFAPPPPPPGSASTSAEVETPAPEDARSTVLSKRSVPPLWINVEYDTHRTKAIAFPPLFVHRTPKAGHPEKLLHVDLALTFGWYSKRSKKRRWFNPAALYFGSYSDRKTVWGAVPILAGYRRVGEKFNFGQFPLVWWWGTKFVKNFLFIPFHYQQRSPDGFRGVSATVLFWYGHKNLDDANLDNDRRHFVAAPFFYRFRRGLKQFDFAFLYIGGYNKLKGRKYTAAAPFMVLAQNEFGNRREVWTIPFIRRTDKARRKRVWAIPPALTFGHRDPDKRVFSATPLFWRTENLLKGSRLTIAGPVGHYSDPTQRNTVVAPLWYTFHDKKANASTHLLVPLSIIRKSPERTAVWTLLGGGAKTKNGYGFGLPPLLTFARKRDDGSSYQVVAGAFVHTRNPAKQHDTWVAGPLAYYGRRGPAHRVGLPPLLTFTQFGGPKRYQVITPFFWHVREPDPARNRRTIVTGPFYHHKTVAGYDGGVAPAFFYGNNDKYAYGIVPWLLFADVNNRKKQQHLTLSPFFVRSKGPKNRTVGVLGLGWDVKRENEHHTGVVPLFYRRRIGDRSLTVTPVGGRYRKGKEITSVFGLYYRRKTHNRNGFGVLPLLFHDSHPVEGGRSTHSVFVPAFLRRRTPADDLDMWTPLVWRSNVRGDKPRRGLAVVPLYFRQRQRGGVDVDAGLGFFYSRDRRRRTHTLIVGPGFRRLSRKSVNEGIAPLWWWLDSEKKRRLIALPAIFHFEDKPKDTHTTIAVPLWFDRKRGAARRAWGVFPFVFGDRRGHNFTRFSLAPPGFIDLFRLRRNMRFTGFVPLAFRYQKCGFQSTDDAKCRYQLWGSVPLFLYGKDGQGRVTHGALAYYFDRDKDGYKFYTPVFGLHNKPGKVLGWYGGPLAVKTTNTHRRIMFFPLYFRRAHRLKDENLTLIVPPLFISRNRQDRRFFEAGLLFWQFRQRHKVATAIVPPIFFHSHAWEQRRLHWLLPFYIRDNNKGADKTFTAVTPGLYFQRRNGENFNFVQFPLVWHIERGRNQGTFGAFVWWDIRVKGKMVQLVPAAFTRVANPERDTSVIGPGLGWWTKGKGLAEGDLSWRALLGAFGGGRVGGRRYISIFGAKIDRGPVPAKKQSRIDAREARRQKRLEAKVIKAEKRRASR